MLLFLTIIFCLFVIGIYFVPSFIAIGRKHTYVLQITLLNALLGWSFFGWAAALIWSTTDHIDEYVNTKLSWVIITIFTIAVIFPVIFFFGLFGMYVPGEIEIKEPQNIEKIEYHGYFYKLKPENVVKQKGAKETTKEKSNKEPSEDNDK